MVCAVHTLTVIRDINPLREKNEDNCSSSSLPTISLDCIQSPEVLGMQMIHLLFSFKGLQRKHKMITTFHISNIL